MAYCKNCGSRLVDGAKFCQKCGCAVTGDPASFGQRRQEYEGKIYKCPNCGEILPSFVRACPACGLELRGVRATGAVKEFALKLEAIESRRRFQRIDSNSEISTTDEQKINLIKSFSVPNSKEDILEFMILATSNVNMRTYDHFNNNPSKSEEAINDAWLSKIKQVYEKAKNSYGNEDDFAQIRSLYENCSSDINKAKKKNFKAYIITIILIFGLMPAIIILFSIIGRIQAPGRIKKENERLEAIEQEVDSALENGEYKKALLNAESMNYEDNASGKESEEMERKWDIRRDLLIDEIIEEAEKNGVHLERTQD